MRLKIALLAAAVTLASVAVLSQGTASADPTCSDSDLIDVEVHGQHVIHDYVIGEDGTGPGGGEGAEIPGGPGPGFHFPNGVAPGASFCLEQSNSPGFPH